MEDIKGQGKFPRAVRELQDEVFARSRVVRTPNTLTDTTTRGVAVRPTRNTKSQSQNNQGSTIPRWG